VKRALALGSILLIPAALLLGGCYTVLKHPAVSDSDSESGSEPQIVGRANSCASCHSDAEMEAIVYGAHHRYYPDSDWDRFYVWPWWRDDYWASHGGGGGGALPPAGDRREQGQGLDNRRPGLRVVPPGGVTAPAPPPKKDDGSGSDSKNDDKQDDSKKAPEKHDQGQSMPNTRPRP
jgi:hypothetical protein